VIILSKIPQHISSSKIILENRLCEENTYTYRVEHIFMGQKLLVILLLSIARRYRN
jgi:hypothetical protein